MPNYRALAAYLHEIQTLTIRMTFAEIEAITGRLPATSRTLRQFWENHPGKPQSRDGWLAAGYETSKVSIEEQALEFTRSAPARRARRRSPRITS
jgi:hypothetical protein